MLRPAASMTKPPFPSGAKDGIVVRLLHAGTKEMLATRLSDSDAEKQAFPPWAVDDGEDRNGMVTVGAEGDKHLRVTLLGKFVKGAVATKVVIEALYEIDLESPDLEPTGDTVYDRIPNAFRRVFAQLVLDELFPYLREAIQRASSAVLPTEPILLSPPGGAMQLTLDD